MRCGFCGDAIGQRKDVDGVLCCSKCRPMEVARYWLFMGTMIICVGLTILTVIAFVVLDFKLDWAKYDIRVKDNKIAELELELENLQDKYDYIKGIERFTEEEWLEREQDAVLPDYTFYEEPSYNPFIEEPIEEEVEECIPVCIDPLCTRLTVC